MMKLGRRCVTMIVIACTSCTGAEGPCDTGTASLPTGSVSPTSVPSSDLQSSIISIDARSVTVAYTDAGGRRWNVTYLIQK